MLGPRPSSSSAPEPSVSRCIGLLCNFKAQLGIDEVLFHKRTPLLTDRSKVQDLLRRGARLVTDKDRIDGFKKMGLQGRDDHRRGPRGRAGGRRLHAQRQRHEGTLVPEVRGRAPTCSSPRAASSASASRTPAASTTRRCEVGRDKYLQVVSCNTHNLSVLIKTFGRPTRGRTT